MGVYAVTGAASGMGAASADRLRAAGHTVITVDLKEADVVADLSTPAGRSAAVRRTLERAGNRLDGAVLAAGLGPVPGKEHTLAQVNVRGVIELLEGWRPALAAAGNSKVVVFGSNSTTTTPAVPMSAVRAFLAGDLEKGVRRAGRIRPAAAPLHLRRVEDRRHPLGAPERGDPGLGGGGDPPERPRAGRGVDPPSSTLRSRARRAIGSGVSPSRSGGFGEPDRIAEWVEFMLSPAADFLVGSVVVVDGGSEAWFRAVDWPRPVPVRKVLRYVRRMRSFRR